MAAAWSLRDAVFRFNPAQCRNGLMQRNDSVELSSLLPHRPSSKPYRRKWLRRFSSVEMVAPRVGTDDPWNTSALPTVISPLAVSGLIIPSPFTSRNVYGVPQ